MGDRQRARRPGFTVLVAVPAASILDVTGRCCTRAPPWAVDRRSRPASSCAATAGDPPVATDPSPHRVHVDVASSQPSDTGPGRGSWAPAGAIPVTTSAAAAATLGRHLPTGARPRAMPAAPCRVPRIARLLPVHCSTPPNDQPAVPLSQHPASCIGVSGAPFAQSKVDMARRDSAPAPRPQHRPVAGPDHWAAALPTYPDSDLDVQRHQHQRWTTPLNRRVGAGLQVGNLPNGSVPSEASYGARHSPTGTWPTR